MSRARPPDQDERPLEVGPYRIQEKLGAGGMGEVYRAWDTRLERAVAIKKVRAQDAGEEKSRRRLWREARAVARLNHPAIVRIFDLQEGDDGDWIVMELVAGRTLRSLLDHRLIVEIEALALAREITEGLAAAHAKGLVHRDLKSENVMVTHLGHVKILDFGLAEPFAEEDGAAAAVTGRKVAGTSRAMSPEQAMGLPLDPRSDLFSLGTLLYEMVTGESPFQGASSHVTMTRVCRHRQRPAREVEPGVSAELSNLIDQLLEKDPARRPKSADDVSAVLDSLAGIAPLPPSLVYLVRPAASPAGPMPALADGAIDGPATLLDSLAAASGFGSNIFVWTVLYTDLTNAAELLRHWGDERASRIFLRHDRFVRELLPRFSGLEIEKADGFFLLFRRPVDAVRFALAHQQGLAALAEELGAELAVRTGIHMGEVHLRENPPDDVARGAKPFEAEGRTRLVASRVMELARPGQILITRGAYEPARLAKLEPETVGQQVTWKQHGEKAVPGLEEKMQIFEIALAGRAAPPDDAPASRRWRWVAVAAVVLGLLAVAAVILMTR